jgi:hypothetical protein
MSVICVPKKYIILKYKQKREAELLEQDENNELLFGNDDVDDDDVDQDDLDDVQVNIDSIGDNEEHYDDEEHYDEPSSSKVTPKRRKYVVLEDDEDEDVPEQEEDVEETLKSDGKTQRSATRLYKNLKSEFNKEVEDE